jgi:hypothetical protein
MKGEVKQVNGKRVATTEYRSWQMMKNRCLNSRTPDYKYYGGRGIMIDPQWMDYDVFLADMGRKPDPKMTLERINNAGPYAWWNCAWATRKHQSRNRDKYHTCDFGTAERIRELYAGGKGGFTQKQIAAFYRLTQTDISQITRNVRWSDETGPKYNHTHGGYRHGTRKGGAR